MDGTNSMAGARRANRRSPAQLGGWFALCVLLSIARLGIADDPSKSGEHVSTDHSSTSHEGHDHHEAGHGDHAEHGHGKSIHGEAPKNYFGPKTEFLYWSPQLFIWTLLLFLPLWFLLQKLVWGPMIRGLEERDRKVTESLAMAARLREEAKTISAEQDADVIRAQQEARSLLDQARADTSARVADIIAKAKDEAAIEQQKAREQIESAVQVGRADLDRQVEQVARDIAQSLTATGGSR